MIWDMGSERCLVCLAAEPRQTPAVHPGWHLLVTHPRPARQAPSVPAIAHTLKFSEIILGRAYHLGRDPSQRARQAVVRLAPWPPKSPKAWISIVHACLSRHTIAHISLAARSRCAVYDKMMPHEGRLNICPRKPTRHVSLSSVEIIQKYSIVPKERLAPSPQAPGKGRVPPRHDLHLPSAPLPNPRCAPTQRRASKQALKVCRRVVRYGANQFLRYGRENLGRPSGSQRIRSVQST